MKSLFYLKLKTGRGVNSLRHSLIGLTRSITPGQGFTRTLTNLLNIAFFKNIFLLFFLLSKTISIVYERFNTQQETYSKLRRHHQPVVCFGHLLQHTSCALRHLPQQQPFTRRLMFTNTPLATNRFSTTNCLVRQHIFANLLPCKLLSASHTLCLIKSNYFNTNHSFKTTNTI